MKEMNSSREESMDNRPRLVVAESVPERYRERDDAIIRRYADIADVHFITDSGFLKKYMAAREKADVLLTDEGMLRLLSGMQAGKILLQGRMQNSDGSWPPQTEILPERIPGEELFRKIDAALSCEPSAERMLPGTSGETRIAAVYSPIGGCGKSLTAIALARKLRRLDQKVLVVGCDPMQSFSVFLENNEYAGDELIGQLRNPSEDTYWTILRNIRTDGISWLCPFEKSLSTLGIGAAEWGELCRILQAKKDFDIIILDLGTEMTCQMVELIDHFSALILLTEANEIANRKLQKLLKNPQLLPKCNCILVANEYHADGMRIARESLFGSIAPYATWEEAMDDPVFYRIALQITG